MLPRLPDFLYSTTLLLLILNELNIVLRDLLMIIEQPILHLITHIALHGNLLPTRRSLRHRTSRRKLLAKLLGHLLQIQSKSFQPRNLRDEFPLVPLHALDVHFRGGALFALPRFLSFGFGGFLLGVFFGAFLRVYGEGGEVLGSGVGAVEFRVQVWVVGGEPVGAFFGCAAVFTVLKKREG